MTHDYHMISLPRIPKLSKKTALLTEANQYDWKEVEDEVKRSFLTPSSTKWTVDQIEMINNNSLLKHFKKRKAEIKQEVGGKAVSESFAFICSSDYEKIISEGVSVDPNQTNTLGDSSMGVHVYRCADTCLESNRLHADVQQLQLIVLKVVLGKQKTVALHASPALEPTPNYHCHVPTQQAKTTEMNYTAAPKTQVYLFQYDDDYMPEKQPKQCLPYALATISYNRPQLVDSYANLPQGLALPHGIRNPLFKMTKSLLPTLSVEGSVNVQSKSSDYVYSENNNLPSDFATPVHINSTCNSFSSGGNPSNASGRRVLLPTPNIKPVSNILGNLISNTILAQRAAPASTNTGANLDAALTISSLLKEIADNHDNIITKPSVLKEKQENAMKYFSRDPRLKKKQLTLISTAQVVSRSKGDNATRDNGLSPISQGHGKAGDHCLSDQPKAVSKLSNDQGGDRGLSQHCSMLYNYTPDILQVDVHASETSCITTSSPKKTDFIKVNKEKLGLSAGKKKTKKKVKNLNSTVRLDENDIIFNPKISIERLKTVGSQAEISSRLKQGKDCCIHTAKRKELKARSSREVSAQPLLQERAIGLHQVEKDVIWIGTKNDELKVGVDHRVALEKKGTIKKTRNKDDVKNKMIVNVKQKKCKKTNDKVSASDKTACLKKNKSLEVCLTKTKYLQVPSLKRKLEHQDSEIDTNELICTKRKPDNLYYGSEVNNNTIVTVKLGEKDIEGIASQLVEKMQEKSSMVWSYKKPEDFKYSKGVRSECEHLSKTGLSSTKPDIIACSTPRNENIMSTNTQYQESNSDYVDNSSFPKSSSEYLCGMQTVSGSSQAIGEKDKSDFGNEHSHDGNTQLEESCNLGNSGVNGVVNHNTKASYLVESRKERCNKKSEISDEFSEAEQDDSVDSVEEITDMNENANLNEVKSVKEFTGKVNEREEAAQNNAKNQTAKYKDKQSVQMLKGGSSTKSKDLGLRNIFENLKELEGEENISQAKLSSDLCGDESTANESSAEMPVIQESNQNWLEHHSQVSNQKTKQLNFSDNLNIANPKKKSFYGDPSEKISVIGSSTKQSEERQIALDEENPVSRKLESGFDSEDKTQIESEALLESIFKDRDDFPVGKFGKKDDFDLCRKKLLYSGEVVSPVRMMPDVTMIPRAVRRSKLPHLKYPKSVAGTDCKNPADNTTENNHRKHSEISKAIGETTSFSNTTNSNRSEKNKINNLKYTRNVVMSLESPASPPICDRAPAQFLFSNTENSIQDDNMDKINKEIQITDSRTKKHTHKMTERRSTLFNQNSNKVSDNNVMDESVHSEEYGAAISEDFKLNRDCIRFKYDHTGSHDDDTPKFEDNSHCNDIKSKQSCERPKLFSDLWRHKENSSDSWDEKLARSRMSKLVSQYSVSSESESDCENNYKAKCTTLNLFVEKSELLPAGVVISNSPASPVCSINTNNLAEKSALCIPGGERHSERQNILTSPVYKNTTLNLCVNKSLPENVVNMDSPASPVCVHRLEKETLCNHNKLSQKPPPASCYSQASLLHERNKLDVKTSVVEIIDSASGKSLDSPESPVSAKNRIMVFGKVPPSSVLCYSPASPVYESNDLGDSPSSPIIPVVDTYLYDVGDTVEDPIPCVEIPLEIQEKPGGGVKEKWGIDECDNGVIKYGVEGSANSMVDLKGDMKSKKKVGSSLLSETGIEYTSLLKGNFKKINRSSEKCHIEKDATFSFNGKMEQSFFGSNSKVRENGIGSDAMFSFEEVGLTEVLNTSASISSEDSCVIVDIKRKTTTFDDSCYIINMLDSDHSPQYHGYHDNDISRLCNSFALFEIEKVTGRKRNIKQVNDLSDGPFSVHLPSKKRCCDDDKLECNYLMDAENNELLGANLINEPVSCDSKKHVKSDYSSGEVGNCDDVRNLEERRLKIQNDLRERCQLLRQQEQNDGLKEADFFHRSYLPEEDQVKTETETNASCEKDTTQKHSECVGQLNQNKKEKCCTRSSENKPTLLEREKMESNICDNPQTEADFDTPCKKHSRAKEIKTENSEANTESKHVGNKWNKEKMENLLDIGQTLNESKTFTTVYSFPALEYNRSMTPLIDDDDSFEELNVKVSVLYTKYMMHYEKFNEMKEMLLTMNKYAENYKPMYDKYKKVEYYLAGLHIELEHIVTYFEVVRCGQNQQAFRSNWQKEEMASLNEEIECLECEVNDGNMNRLLLEHWQKRLTVLYREFDCIKGLTLVPKLPRDSPGNKKALLLRKMAETSSVSKVVFIKKKLLALQKLESEEWKD